MSDEKDEKQRGKRGHAFFPEASPLSEGGKALLERLQLGGNFSEPSPGWDAFAYSHHAEIFLNNARRLCEDDAMSDFRVYGALYTLRHGLELMLKCMSRNVQIDKILEILMRPEMTFINACASIWQSAKERRRKEPILRHAVCAIRNVLEDHIEAPRCHTSNIDDSFADRALAYFRSNPETDRFLFALHWPVASAGHDLNTLWGESEPVISAFAEAAERHAVEAGVSPPMTPPEMKSLVDMLWAMDDGGQGLRYPSSISGSWYFDPPRMSLQALGPLIYRLEETCKMYEAAREESYNESTFGRYGPR